MLSCVWLTVILHHLFARAADIDKVLITATPLGRRATPEEVVHVSAFLASDALITR